MAPLVPPIPKLSLCPPFDLRTRLLPWLRQRQSGPTVIPEGPRDLLATDPMTNRRAVSPTRVGASRYARPREILAPPEPYALRALAGVLVELALELRRQAEEERPWTL